jgi:hypothetical protein
VIIVKNKKLFNLLVNIFLIGIIFLVDQVSKYIVETKYAKESVAVIKDFFHITYVKNMKKLLISILVIAAFLGCTSVDPYTGESKVNNKTKYGAGGAAIGAIIGQVAGKDSEATAIGAAVGTAVGLGYGAYRDNQEAELRKSLEKILAGEIREESNIEMYLENNKIEYR